MIRHDWPFWDNAGGWLLLLIVVGVLCLLGMGWQTRHRRYDPTCGRFREPRSAWQRWRFRRCIGRPCPACCRAALSEPCTGRWLDR